MTDLTPQDIRALRKRVGWTQAEAARVVGYGPKTFARYEHGQTPMPLAALCTFLSVVDSLLRQQDEIVTRIRSRAQAA